MKKRVKFFKKKAWNNYKEDILPQCRFLHWCDAPVLPVSIPEPDPPSKSPAGKAACAVRSPRRHAVHSSISIFTDSRHSLLLLSFKLAAWLVPTAEQKRLTNFCSSSSLLLQQLHHITEQSDISPAPFFSCKPKKKGKYPPPILPNIPVQSTPAVWTGLGRNPDITNTWMFKVEETDWRF